MGSAGSGDLDREQVVRLGAAEPWTQMLAAAQDLVHELREGLHLLGAELALVTGQGGPARGQVPGVVGHAYGQEARVRRRPGNAAFALGDTVLRESRIEEDRPCAIRPR